MSDSEDNDVEILGKVNTDKQEENKTIERQKDGRARKRTPAQLAATKRMLEARAKQRAVKKEEKDDKTYKELKQKKKQQKPKPKDESESEEETSSDDEQPLNQCGKQKVKRAMIKCNMCIIITITRKTHHIHQLRRNVPQHHHNRRKSPPHKKRQMTMADLKLDFYRREIYICMTLLKTKI